MVESQNLNPCDPIQDQVPAQADMRVNHLHTSSKEGTSQRLKSEQTSENEILKPLNYPHILDRGSQLKLACNRSCPPNCIL